MNKYRNRKTEVFGILFDSKHEAGQYIILKTRLDAGEITDLHCQVQYACDVNGQHVCNYFADFTYLENGELVVVDAKSEATRKDKTYRIKKKLVEALYKIEIIEV